MVHSITCFTSIIATLNTYVNLPNGEVASITHIGTVKILERLTLHNVLCVPSFNFNLISIRQLAKSTVCCLIFFGNLCFIQYLAHWSTLGLGRNAMDFTRWKRATSLHLPFQLLYIALSFTSGTLDWDIYLMPN